MTARCLSLLRCTTYSRASCLLFVVESSGIFWLRCRRFPRPSEQKLGGNSLRRHRHLRVVSESSDVGANTLYIEEQIWTWDLDLEWPKNRESEMENSTCVNTSCCVSKPCWRNLHREGYDWPRTSGIWDLCHPSWPNTMKFYQFCPTTLLYFISEQ